MQKPLSYLVDDDDDDDDDDDNDSLTLVMTLHACQRICLFEDFHSKRNRRHNSFIDISTMRET